MAKFKIKVGSIVAFNTCANAVWFEVLEIDGFSIKVQEHKTDYSHQWIDSSLIKQIK